ncbi:hypothetical protein BY996DRAFT_6454348 [Phakopsora pachyrhizi]|nr:hypothetical protein BY996DRAFT_6454348 [Phakopsora pachyrhizi]
MVRFGCKRCLNNNFECTYTRSGPGHYIACDRCYWKKAKCAAYPSAPGILDAEGSANEALCRDRCGKLPKADRAGLGRVGTAGRAMGRARGAILQGRRHKGLYGDMGIDNRRAKEGKNALWRNIDCSTDKEAVGREEAGGRPEEVSVGLVRRRNAALVITPELLEIAERGSISKAVVGRAVGEDCWAGLTF